MAAMVGQDVWFFGPRGTNQKAARITFVVTDDLVNLMVEPDGPNPQAIQNVSRGPSNIENYFTDKADKPHVAARSDAKEPPAVKPVAPSDKKSIHPIPGGTKRGPKTP